MTQIPGRSQGSLNFAAGSPGSRDQLSSTWIVRITRGPEVYVLNRDAGGELGHIWLHKDGPCHAKFKTGPSAKTAIYEWTLPEPLPGSDVRRLADVVIPHRGLAPISQVPPDPDTVLIPPPEEGQQLHVSLFLEPGPVDQASWPGQTAMSTGYVGRATLYAHDRAVMNFTAVTSYWPESDLVVCTSMAHHSAVPTVERPEALRVVVFQYGEDKGLGVPSLIEMPVGHLSGALTGRRDLRGSDAIGNLGCL
jgi:hypothetical protein